MTIDWKDPETYREIYEESKKRFPRTKEPYVVWGKPTYDRTGGGCVMKPDIHRCRIGLCHNAETELQSNIRKGWVVLDYWIPTSNDDIPRPTARGNTRISHGWAEEFKTAEGKDRLAAARAILEQAKFGVKEQVELKAKAVSLEEKLAAAEAKLAKLEGGRNAK